MPRTRSKGNKFPSSVTRRVSYKETSDTSDDEHNPGLLNNILGLLINMQRMSGKKKTKKKTAKEASKRKQSAGGCDCPHCSIRTPKRRCTVPKTQRKGKAEARTSTATAANKSLSLESDDEEIVGTNITTTHENTIKNKVDNFFKALDSDEEEQESKLNTSDTPSSPKQAEKKSKDFYTILSDSEDEKEQPSTAAENTNCFSQPSTSGLSMSNCLSSGLKLFSHKPERRPEDLFAYVDDILNDCNIVDITNDKPKENVPVESLEDLKKKTDEILGSVTSLIDDLKPKPKESEKKDSPQKEAPTCPICLETLGGSRLTMATFCGHMFCEPCITQVAKTSKKCPTCRKGVTKTKYHPVYI